MIKSDLGVDHWWAQVKTNLQAGKIRMLFVADRIPAELKRVVEFLNVQMQPAEVLAIELRQYEGQGLKALVPIVHGQTQEAVQKKGPTSREGRVWDEASILSELATRSTAPALETAKSIALWIRDRADEVQFNTNATWGSMGPVFRVAGMKLYPFLIHTDNSTLAVYFQYMIGKPVFDDLSKRQELLDRLNAVAGINLPPDAVSKRKSIPLSAFTPETTREFLSVMDWFVAQLRAGQH